MSRPAVRVVNKPLRDALPHDHQVRDSERVSRYLDVIVLKAYNGTLVAFPSNYKNVFVWWELENGMAVGWNENMSLGWSFPVVSKNKLREAKETYIPAQTFFAEIDEDVEKAVSLTPSDTRWEPKNDAGWGGGVRTKNVCHTD